MANETNIYTELCMCSVAYATACRCIFKYLSIDIYVSVDRYLSINRYIDRYTCLSINQCHIMTGET